MAEVLHGTYGQVELNQILDVGAFELGRALELDPEFLNEGEHQHDQTVTSVGIELAGDLDGERLNQWLGWLLSARGTDIFRMKGVLSIADDERRFVFQGVQMLFDSQPDRPWAPGEARVNRLVFIGRNLDRSELNRQLVACLRCPGAPGPVR